MLSEHRRVKHGEQPGDVSRRVKIALREMRPGSEVSAHPWQVLNWGCAKSFRRYLRDKGRAVQRRRDRAAAEAGLLNCRED